MWSQCHILLEPGGRITNPPLQCTSWTSSAYIKKLPDAVVAFLPTNFLAVPDGAQHFEPLCWPCHQPCSRGGSRLDVVQDNKPFYTAGVSSFMLPQDSFRRLVAVWSVIRINDTSVKDAGLCK
eukprot:scaffold3483_cov115-Skeletonema_dohrnii-CCMP3373.AAC.2